MNWLRPYHNPENVDESRVPKGWPFLYADEFSNGIIEGSPRFVGVLNCNFDPLFGRIAQSINPLGITYIVPVDA